MLQKETENYKWKNRPTSIESERYSLVIIWTFGIFIIEVFTFVFAGFYTFGLISCVPGERGGYIKNKI